MREDDEWRRRDRCPTAPGSPPRRGHRACGKDGLVRLCGIRPRDSEGNRIRAPIVENKGSLARLQAVHLTRNGIRADIAHNINEATALMLEKPYRILSDKLMLSDQSALAVADLANGPILRRTPPHT
ncbi:hypothetical protein [Aquicoccus sp.]|uniref:hypothetical protein n=1 Tax=Aquicoccus sp. TaxID=2055851 RepID=UPI003564EF28